MKVRISVKLLRLVQWLLIAYVVFYAGKIFVGWADNARDEHIRQAKNDDRRIEKIVYRSPRQPTEQEMTWLGDDRRNGPFLAYPVLYGNIISACYRDGKLQIAWTNPQRTRESRYFSEVAAKDTNIMFNAESESGWLIYYRKWAASENYPAVYATVIHLPQNYGLASCP